MNRKKVDREIGDAIELFESAHYIVPSHDSEAGHTRYTRPDPPTFRSVRRLKQRHSDYRAGPVKVYTREEIEEYERVRSQELHDSDG